MSRADSDGQRLSRYKITPEQFSDMLERQGGVCAICKQPEKVMSRWGTTYSLAIDHDHACCPQEAKCCGKCVRGLLCSACNNGLHRFRDDPTRLRAAANYLEETT